MNAIHTQYTHLELMVGEDEVQELPDTDQDHQHHREQDGHSPKLLYRYT